MPQIGAISTGDEMTEEKTAVQRLEEEAI